MSRRQPPPREAEVLALIDSLNLAEPSDPQARWRPQLQSLSAKLALAEKHLRLCSLLGPALAIIAFVIFDLAKLNALQIALTSAAALGFAGAIIAPAKATRQAASGIAGLGMAGLHFIQALQPYIILAALVTMSVSYLLERLHPALDHRDRIQALLRYFKFNVPGEVT